MCVIISDRKTNLLHYTHTHRERGGGGGERERGGAKIMFSELVGALRKYGYATTCFHLHNNDPLECVAYSSSLDFNLSTLSRQ